MGFLKSGTPLPWSKALGKLKYVREHGVAQFLKVYERIKDRSNDQLRWGDELEYHLVEFDDDRLTVRMACIAPAVLELLEAQDAADDAPAAVTWHPEYGSWMVEATPGQPYGRTTGDLRTVEPNMAHRRARIQAALDSLAPHTRPLSCVAFPLMGVGTDFLSPPAALGGAHSRSAYFSDFAISPHPRFGTLTANIRRRRGERVTILLPLFPDTATDLSAPVLHLDNTAQATDTAPALHHVEGDEEEAGGGAAEGGGKHPFLKSASDASITSTSSSIRHTETPLLGVPSALLHQTAASATASALAPPPSGSGTSAAVAPPPVHPHGTTPTALPLPPSAAGGGELTGPPVFTSPEDDALDAASDAASAAAEPFLPPGWVHGDAMGFGMGCCCLQVTFQARDIKQSRFLYDQLGILAPLLLALTANTAIFRGRLVNTDTRWDIIAASVDGRTPSERGGGFGTNGLPASVELGRAAAAAAPAGPSPVTTSMTGGAAAEGPPSFPHGNGQWGGQWPGAGWQVDSAPGEVGGAAGAGRRPVPKSRYDSISRFMSDSRWALPAYNDVPTPVDQSAYAQLVAGGVDDALAQHLAHLFIRDPLVVFTGAVEEVDDEASTEHFENIQSTNWHSVRWKPPPPDKDDIGWRVEVRTMEVQVTDYENAAFTVFTVLASRVVLFFDLNLYIPMSLVEENFARARQPGAINTGKFWFRRNVTPLAERCGPTEAPTGAPGGAPAVHWEEMRLAEILLGKGSDGPAGTPAAFPGLIPLIFAYLDIIHCDAATRLAVDGYLRLVADRARGIAQTGAGWTRAFVRGHPGYNHDSLVTPEIAHDLLQRMDDIAAGRVVDKDLLCAAAELAASNAREATAVAAGQGAAQEGAGDGPTLASVTGGSATMLRGASFAEELRSVQDCLVLQGLVGQYTVQSSFDSTPSFLPTTLFTPTEQG